MKKSAPRLVSGKEIAGLLKKMMMKMMKRRARGSPFP